jgi:hypothetical protein
MKYYRCYFLNADDRIVHAKILKCADEEDAKRQCREVAAAERSSGAEVWDGARRVYHYPDDLDAPMGERRRREGKARDQDLVVTDALSAQVAEERRNSPDSDAIKAARMREQLLATTSAMKKS